MLGKDSPQRGMFEADNLYIDYVGRDTFYQVMVLCTLAINPGNAIHKSAPAIVLCSIELILDHLYWRAASSALQS